MIKNIFFLTKNEFVALAIKEALKKQDVDCYTLGTTHDIFYLIKDLGPQLILVDYELFAAEKEEFKSGLKENNLAPLLVLTGTNPEWAQVDQSFFIGHLPKPLVPFAVKDLLNRLLNLQ